MGEGSYPLGYVQNMTAILKATVLDQRQVYP